MRESKIDIVKISTYLNTNTYYIVDELVAALPSLKVGYHGDGCHDSFTENITANLHIEYRTF